LAAVFQVARRLDDAAGLGKVQMTKVVTYRVLLREGEDGTD